MVNQRWPGYPNKTGKLYANTLTVEGGIRIKNGKTKSIYDLGLCGRAADIVAHSIGQLVTVDSVNPLNKFVIPSPIRISPLICRSTSIPPIWKSKHIPNV